METVPCTVLCLCIAFLLHGMRVTQGEFFTSVRHMHTLVDIELQLKESLQRYVREEEHRLARLRSLLSTGLNTSALDHEPEGVSKYLGHPINAFKTISRLTKEWPKVEQITRADFSKEMLKKFDTYRNWLPTTEDLRGAEDALNRLQETYDLTSTAIADGIAPQRYPRSKMNAQDTFSMGKNAYFDKNYKRAQMWMGETLRLLDLGRIGEEDEVPSRFDVLDHLAWSEYLAGDLERAFNHTLELHDLDPTNERIAENVKLFKRYVHGERFKKEKELERQSREKRDVDKRGSKKAEEIKYSKFYYTVEENEYERYLVEKEVAQKLCRGLVQPIPKSDKKHLVCWYKRDSLKLLIKPVRLERIFVKPELVFYRGVLNDKEIQQIKELANPKLNRATVHNPTTGKLEYADYRVSKSAWLDSDDGPVVSRINQKIEDLTGLNLETAEMLQVANYGIAGHYETHFDFSRYAPIRPPPWKPATDVTIRVKHEVERSAYLELNGNRIATFLIYLSDVEEGGGTVFTNIGALVKPSKGDAVFWYNLYRDGSGDYDTRHAACPVLIGEKWVANKWIHERGQEFRRKCGLTPRAV